MQWRKNQTTRLARKLAEQTIRDGQYPLLILPSSDAAFRLLADCDASGMPVRGVGNPGLMTSWGIGIVSCIMTPAMLWGGIKTQGKLSCAIAVFEDQLVAIDDSYLRVEVDGQMYMVSPIVMMILMKFRPRSYIGNVSPEQPSITLTKYSPDVPQSMTPQAANTIMEDVLRPLLTCEDNANTPWFARSFFPLKRNHNFNRVLLHQVQEMETLVRLCCAAHPESAVLPGWLDVLRTGRIELTKPLQQP